MAIPTKYRKLKSVAGQTEVGGAPFFSEDFVKMQENAAADIYAFYEKIRKRLPEFDQASDGVTPGKYFESGLIVSGLQYNKTAPTSTTVSAGYIYSGGELCYFPGGTFTVGAVGIGVLFLYKGAPVYTNRTFEDASSKEMLVEHPVVVEQSTVGLGGALLPGGTGITASDEVVVLEISNNAFYYGERYFTPEAALKLNALGGRLNTNAFTPASFPYTGIVPNTSLGIQSRKTIDNFTEIVGRLTITAAAQSGVSISLCDLNASAHANTLGAVGVTASIVSPVSQQNVYLNVTFNNAGVLSAIEPLGGWPGLDLVVSISAIVYARPSAPSSFTYENDFLDIT